MSEPSTVASQPRSCSRRARARTACPGCAPVDLQLDLRAALARDLHLRRRVAAAGAARCDPVARDPPGRASSRAARRRSRARAGRRRCRSPCPGRAHHVVARGEPERHVVRRGVAQLEVDARAGLRVGGRRRRGGRPRRCRRPRARSVRQPPASSRRHGRRALHAGQPHLGDRDRHAGGSRSRGSRCARTGRDRR